MGGIGPGILLTVLNIIAIKLMVKRHPDWGPNSEKSGWKERWKKTMSGGLVEIAIIFIISMGGMFAGFFTATEAGAVGAFGLLLIVIIRRKINWSKFWDAVASGIRLEAMVFMLLGCAAVFSKMFTVSTIPSVLGDFVNSLHVSGWVVLAVILIIYIILGMFADLLSMMLVTLPIFFPIVVGQLGFSAVWFGIIMSILIGTGGITPPVGSGVFMTRGCISWDKAATVTALFKGIWPFVLASIICIILLIIFPGISTFLPDLIFRS